MVIRGGTSLEAVRQHKDRAAAFLAKGKRKQALMEYRKALGIAPSDVQIRQRYADLLARLGDEPAAIREYQAVAGKYAADGFLVKAMAICKVILKIDPDHRETQEVLARLFGEDAPSAVLPASMTGAMGTARDGGLRVTPARAGPIVSPAASPPSGGGVVVPSMPLPRAMPAVQLPTISAEVRGAKTKDSPRPPSALPGSGPAGAPPGVPPLPGAGVAAESAGSTTDAADPRNRPPDPDALRSATPIPGVPGEPTATAAGDPVGPADVTQPADTTQPAGDVDDDDDPDTLVLGLFEPTGEAPLPRVTDPSLYLNLVDEDSLEDELDDELVHDSGALPDTEPVSTPEMAIDTSKFAPIPLFSELSREAFMAIFHRLEVRNAPVGELLIAEGTRTTTMYILAQGEVRVFRERGDETEELARLRDGSFFGEIALLSDAPRMASVETTKPSLFLEMTRETLAEIIESHPSAAGVLERFYRERFLANLVRSNPLIFQPLSDDEKRDIFERFQSVTVEPGTVLLQKGEMGQGLYLILRGACDVLDAAPDGRLFELPTLHEGDFFGEMSLLLNAPVTATVRAKTTCMVLRLPRDIFYEKVMRHPEVRRVITEVTNERLKQAAALQAELSPDEPVLV
jgi:CRP-like cAMP-binding protein